MRKKYIAEVRDNFQQTQISAATDSEKLKI
jgi:hypothetical protein